MVLPFLLGRYFEQSRHGCSVIYASLGAHPQCQWSCTRDIMNGFSLAVDKVLDY